MDTIVILVVVALLVVIALAIWTVQRRRTARLRERFGDEYERTLDRTGSRRDTEQALTDVAAKRDALTIRPLTTQQREAWIDRWGTVQAQFVDAPADAVTGARDLLPTLMRERGYPVEDFEENATLLAADHPVVVTEYRAAEQAYQRHRAAGGSSTESLRQALVHYRALFEALVHDGQDQRDRPDPDVGREPAVPAEGAVRDEVDDRRTDGRHAADAPPDREARR